MNRVTLEPTIARCNYRVHAVGYKISRQNFSKYSTPAPYTPSYIWIFQHPITLASYNLHRQNLKNSDNIL